MTSFAPSPRLAGATGDRGPVPRWWQRRWWRETWRVLAAAALGALLWVGSASDAPAGKDPVLFLDLLIGLAGCGLLLLRRRLPVPVAAVLTVLSCLSQFTVGPAIFALISLATRRRWREVLAILPLWVASGYVYGVLVPSSSAGIPWWVLAVIGLLTYGVAVAIGFYIGARRELIVSLHVRAETAEREQALRVSQARANERARIAREMHDVLAHRISLVAMHAGALTYRTDLSPEETAEAAGIVRDNAHRALADLRDVLGVLRASGAQEAGSAKPEPPQPTLAGLDALLEESAAAGSPVAVRRDLPDAGAVPEALSRNAYRIIQEGLTNARKHAPHAEVSLDLRGAPEDGLTVRIRNRVRETSPDLQPSLPSSGMGLTGLTERALLAGGELSFGPDADGEFVVTAWLPWRS